MTLRVVSCLGILMALALPACSVIDRVDPPTVTVTGAKVTQTSSQGARVEVMISLDNPNDTALPLTYTQYTITIPGLEPFSYAATSNRTLPAGGKQTIMLPSAFAVPGGGGGLTGKTFTVTGDVSYRPPTGFRRFLTESGIPLPSVPFNHAGPVE